MAVRDDNAADAACVALHKREIGQNQIHAEHIAVRESHAAVDDHHIVPALIECEVLSDLIEAAEEIDPHGRLGGRAAAAAARLARFLFRRALHRLRSGRGVLPLLPAAGGSLLLRLTARLLLLLFRRGGAPLPALASRAAGFSFLLPLRFCLTEGDLLSPYFLIRRLFPRRELAIQSNCRLV